MPLAASLPGAVLETILAHLAPLFLTGADGNLDAARQAAASLLAAYHPETEDELRLAAQIVGFSFHALDALTQAVTPDLPPTRTIRLRGSAVSLSRESHKAQRRLDELQAARRSGTQPKVEPTQPAPTVEKPLDLIADTKKVAAVAQATGLTWTQAYHQRQRATRIANNLKNHHAAPAHALAPAPA